MATKKIMKKICLLGDGAVGKTSLIRKFVYDSFDDRYIVTFGTKVTKKEVRLQPGKVEYDLILMIWDILGQRVHNVLHSSYYHGAAGALIVCDMTRRQTFEGLGEWLKVFRSVCPSAPVIFLGNKADLRDSWMFDSGELAERAAREGAAWFLTSAKTGENVELAFTTLGATLLTTMEGD